MNTGGEMKRIEQCGRNEMAENEFWKRDRRIKTGKN